VARPRGFPRDRVRGPRRQTGWEAGVSEVTTSTNISADTGFIFGTGISPTQDGLTLVRTRGFFRISLTAATAAGDGYVGAVGIGIASNQAFAVGATAVPLPVDENAAESWVWHQEFAIIAPDVTSVDARSMDFHVQIDSKAMRKVGANEILYMALQATETGTAVAEAVANSRMLFKLP